MYAVSGVLHGPTACCRLMPLRPGRLGGRSGPGASPRLYGRSPLLRPGGPGLDGCPEPPTGPADRPAPGGLGLPAPRELHRRLCDLLQEALPGQAACRALALGQQGGALLGAALTRDGRSFCLHCGAGTILFQNEGEHFCKAAALPVNRTRRLRDESLEGQLSVICFSAPVRRILLLDPRLSAAYQNFQDGRAYGVCLPDSVEQLARPTAGAGCIQLLRAPPG